MQSEKKKSNRLLKKYVQRKEAKEKLEITKEQQIEHEKIKKQLYLKLKLKLSKYFGETLFQKFDGSQKSFISTINVIIWENKCN